MAYNLEGPSHNIRDLISDETALWMQRFHDLPVGEIPAEQRTHVLNQITKGIRKDLTKDA